VSSALLLGVAQAQEPAPVGGTTAEQPLRPPVLVVDDLLAPDWKGAKAAHDELLRIGARGVPAVLRARQASPASAQARRALDRTLGALVDALSVEAGAPLEDGATPVAADGALGGMAGAADRDRPDLSIPEVRPDELGDLGSITAQVQRDWLSKRDRARLARGALAHLGPAVTGLALGVPPVRSPEHTAMLLAVTQHIYAAERSRLFASASDPVKREAFRQSYRGLTDLAAPIVAAGVHDEDAAVRAAFQAIRDEAVEVALTALDAEDADARLGAEDALLRLGGLALPALQRVARGEDPARKSVHAVAAAARLARWVRFGLGHELVRRLGEDLEGYEQLDFQGRRAKVIELERLGGAHAIPALRALLREEPSDHVRVVAAIGLFRQGDGAGAEWLALNGGGVPLVRLSARDLSAIYMDQGLRYLTLGRFERAEHEFKQVLEVEPKNEIAWYNLACTYARWGKLDLAFEHLARAIECGFDDVSHMEKDPDLTSLRGDKRYRELLDGIERRRSEK
jgi:tetratricopeptide (TPR) repeat protein